MSLNQTCQSDLHEQTYTYTAHKNVLHYILSSESNRGRFLCVVVVFLCLEYLNLTYLLTYLQFKEKPPYYYLLWMCRDVRWIRFSPTQCKIFCPGSCGLRPPGRVSISERRCAVCYVSESGSSAGFRSAWIAAKTWFTHVRTVASRWAATVVCRLAKHQLLVFRRILAWSIIQSVFTAS